MFHLLHLGGQEIFIELNLIQGFHMKCERLWSLEPRLLSAGAWAGKNKLFIKFLFYHLCLETEGAKLFQVLLVFNLPQYQDLTNV